MARTKDPHVEARNNRLIADVTARPFQSYVDLGRTHGMSDQMVYRVLSENNLVSSERAKPRILAGDKRSISNLHVFIGVELQKEINSEEGLGDIARELGMSPQKLAAICRGVKDLTLSDVTVIAAWLGKSASELISICELKDQKMTTQGMQNQLPRRPGITG